MPEIRDYNDVMAVLFPGGQTLMLSADPVRGRYRISVLRGDIVLRMKGETFVDAAVAGLQLVRQYPTFWDGKEVLAVEIGTDKANMYRIIRPR